MRINLFQQSDISRLARLVFLLDSGALFREAFMKVFPGEKVKTKKEAVSIINNLKVFSKAEREFLQLAKRKGAFTKALKAILNIKEFRQKCAKRIFLSLLPSFLLILMIFAVSILMSFLVFPKIEPVILKKNISLPLILQGIFKLRYIFLSPLSFAIAMFFVSFIFYEIHLICKKHKFFLYVPLARALYKEYYLICESWLMDVFKASNFSLKYKYLLVGRLLGSGLNKVNKNEVKVKMDLSQFMERLKLVEFLNTFITLLASLLVGAITLSLTQLIRSLTTTVL